MLPVDLAATHSINIRSEIVVVTIFFAKRSDPMHTIIPHLWFDKEAKEAAGFYTSIFRDSKVRDTATLHNTPSGSIDLVAVELAGQEFRLISAGPYFKFTPAVSFLVACNTEEEVDTLWGKFSAGGSTLMELGYIRSVKDTAGRRTGTDCPGR
jgi:predicted 3-demethylubiquinone-9 3-methyltransferase (glyoxalase superfamily)